MNTPELVALFLATVLRMATPVGLGAVGATFSERSGVLNIGIEGMMLSGAFGGAVISYYTGSPWLGLLGGMGAGGLMGLILALLSVYIGGDQVVIGVGINVLAFGATNLFLFLIWGNRGTSEWLTALPKLHLPGVSRIPLLGTILSGHDPVVYLSWLVVALAYIVLFRTPFGLWLRAAGEHPTAVETVGLDVLRLRFVAVVLSGVLAGLGGVQLSLGALNIFTQGMSAGRGFLAFAANQFGHWHPVGAFGASLLFGFMDALQMRLQGSGVPSQFLKMLPYLATVFVLATAVRRARSPAALGVPHLRSFARPSGRRGRPALAQGGRGRDAGGLSAGRGSDAGSEGTG